MVLPYINMNPPQVYTCSPSWNPLPPRSPYHPSGSSYCTSPKHPVSCIESGLVIHFICDIIHVSMPFSQIIPPSPTDSKRLFYTSVSLLLSHIQGCRYHLSKFHIYALIYYIGEGNGNPLQYSRWRIPGMGEPGGLLSMGSCRVGHDWSDLAAPFNNITEWNDLLNMNNCTSFKSSFGDKVVCEYSSYIARCHSNTKFYDFMFQRFCILLVSLTFFIKKTVFTSLRYTRTLIFHFLFCSLKRQGKSLKLRVLIMRPKVSSTHE